MDRYDIAIIGTGPAGISAAITATVRNKKVLLIGNKNLSSKVQKAHLISNYPGLPEVTGEEMKVAFNKHLAVMDISITEDKINTIFSMGEYFGIQGAQVMYEADTVILATGVNMGAKYPGEDEYLGKGVSYCATCDAPLYRNKTVAIVGAVPDEETEVDFMSEIAAKVYYFPLYKEEVNVSDKVEVIHQMPREIVGDVKVSSLKTRTDSFDVDGIFILRESVSPDSLVPGLETENGHISVNRLMETNIAGCYACGDVTGRPYQYIKAAGEGNIAALSAVNYIDKKKRK